MSAAPLLAAMLAFAAVIVAGSRHSATDPPSKASRRMDMAGIRTQRDRTAFRALQTMTILAIGGGAAAAGSLLEAPPATGVLMTLAAAAIGWWIPRTWISSRAAERRLEIVAELPAMLDLLQISVRGGMGIHAAWAAVTTSMRGAGDALADEMRQIENEVAFGVGWSDALARSADRTGIPELRSLGSLMAQTERFGSELSRTLDVMAESIRHEETQSLEERAHRASVRMLFPLAALMLPATLLLIVAPLLLLLFEGLLKATA